MGKAMHFTAFCQVPKSRTIPSYYIRKTDVLLVARISLFVCFEIKDISDDKIFF